jgi:Delta7-sterol 5-desaturase
MKPSELPQYSPLITFLILSGVMILRYFFLAGSLYLYGLIRKLKPIAAGNVSPLQIKRDIIWSVLSTFIFAAAGTLIIELWKTGKTLIYFTLSEYGMIYFIFSLFILLFIHESYFYWTHRILHGKYFFQTIHRVHHESRIPSAWTSFSFHPAEALIQAMILPILLIFIPVHWTVLLLFLTIMSVLGVLNHLGYELYPHFWEHKWQMISASHHQLHHQKVSVNFGLYFTFWDKLMGTEGEKR